jgi:Response regulator containing CheY-like receiver domain and AraC-type DNA-binding domain
MYRYIIVDDEVIIRKGLISKINDITSINISCAGEAANGVEGLKLIDDVNPDIIITDMKMRKMDGMEFLDKISERYPEKQIIVISGHKAFDYVNKAIEKRAVGYVLKPFSTEEMEIQLKKAIEQIEQQKSIIQLIRKVASYEQKKEQDVLLEVILEPWNENMEYELHTKNFLMESYYLLLIINTTDKECFSNAEFICSEFLNHIQYTVLVNPVNKNQYFIMISVDEERLIDKMLIKAEHIALHLQKQMSGQKNYICISEVLKGFEKLNRYYTLNDKLLKKVHLTDKACIFHMNEYRKNEETIFNEEYITELFMEMKYHNKKVPDILAKFFEQIDVDKHTLGDIGDICEKLIGKVNDFAIQKGIGTDDIMEVFYRRYLFCDSIEKMQKEISGYIVLILNSIEMQDNSQENISGLILEYIKNNYHHKLTLQDLSAKFYVTPAYCSGLLKQKINQSFNEYISGIRIEKAKKLLTETSLSVENISDEIGYSNPKYFYKIFKKMANCSPIEYRNKY